MDKYTPIRGHVQIVDENNEICTENHNAIVYSGRELISDILFDKSEFRIRGFSFGNKGVLYNNPDIPQKVSLDDISLSNIVEGIPNTSSETLLNEYVNINEENPTYAIKKIKEEFVTRIPDSNNKGYYLITKIIIPIARHEYNGSTSSGLYLNESALWLMDPEYKEYKLFAKSTFNSQPKNSNRSYNAIWTIFF